MAYDEQEKETTYEKAPMIVRIFDTIRNITIHIGLWMLFLGGIAMMAIGIWRLCV